MFSDTLRKMTESREIPKEIHDIFYDQYYNTKRLIQINLNKLCTWFIVIQVKRYEPG